MCRFFSAVYDRTRDALFTGPTDSHSKICELHGIRETSSIAERNIIKLEYLPRGNYYNDFDNYELHVDEERTPDWWTDELAERVTLRMHRRLLAERVLADGETYNITGGLYLVISGAPIITQSGGEIGTCDSSAPVITQSGGSIVIYGSSAPIITQSGGSIWTRDSSAPVITQSGGEIGTYDSSAPIITQSGGEIWTRDSSAPIITRK